MNPIYDFNPILGEKTLMTLNRTRILVNNKPLYFRHLILTTHRILILKSIFQVSFLSALFQKLIKEHFYHSYKMETEILLDDIMDIHPRQHKKLKKVVELTHFTGKTYLMGPYDELFQPVQEAIHEIEALDTLSYKRPSHFLFH